MKITESYLRKIIRGAINEMMSSADATPSFHDSPPPEAESMQSPEQLVDLLVNQVNTGKVSPDLLAQLQRAIETARNKTQQTNTTPYGLGESKRKVK